MIRVKIKFLTFLCRIALEKVLMEMLFKILVKAKNIGFREVCQPKMLKGLRQPSINQLQLKL